MEAILWWPRSPQWMVASVLGCKKWEIAPSPVPLRGENQKAGTKRKGEGNIQKQGKAGGKCAGFLPQISHSRVSEIRLLRLTCKIVLAKPSGAGASFGGSIEGWQTSDSFNWVLDRNDALWHSDPAPSPSPGISLIIRIVVAYGYNPIFT